MTEHKSHVGLSSCFYCGGDHMLLLDKRLENTLPRNVGIIDMSPCSECEEYMEKGVILIGFDEERSDMNKLDRSWGEWRRERSNYPDTDTGLRRFCRDTGLHHCFIPTDGVYRSGHFIVVKDEALSRILGEGDVVKSALHTRWMFIPDSLARQLNGDYQESQERVSDEESTNADNK